jgi:replicative DNA helicase
MANPPPIHSLEAEQALIGSVLIDPAMFDPAVSSETFYLHKHRFVWDAFHTLHGCGQCIDFVTVSDELQRTGHLAEIGGPGYLIGIMADTPNSQNAADYAHIVTYDSVRRAALQACADVAKSIYASNGNLPEVLTEAASRFDDLAPRNSTSLSMADAGLEWYSRIATWLEHGGIPGLTTGYQDIDRCTHGLKRQQLALLAARPSMGKSSLAYQIAYRQAKAGLKVGIFSLEDPREDVFERIALSIHNLDKFTLTASDEEQLFATVNELADLPIRICDDTGLTVAEIGREAHEMRRNMAGLDVVIVDHLGYIDHGAQAREREDVLIGRTNKGLVRIAKEMDVALLALCQLSRSVLDRAVKEPDLQDLRDSGHLEQDARQVWMLHRPGYYADLDEQPDKSVPQEAYVIVRKNTKGPRGDSIRLGFIARSAAFVEYARPADIPVGPA